MDPRIKRELDREDFRMRRLRVRAYGLRLNRTPGEEKIYNYLIPEYEFQVPLLDYIVDFVNLEKGIGVEIDGGYHLAQPRKDINRMWKLFDHCGICTIRFANEEVFNDLEGCVSQIREFEANPTPPEPWIETEEEHQRKINRKVELKEITNRMSNFEKLTIGKTRKEVYELFDLMRPKDDLDLEVLARIKDKLYYWPEDGYVSPGLQRVTAGKLKINQP